MTVFAKLSFLSAVIQGGGPKSNLSAIAKAHFCRSMRAPLYLLALLALYQLYYNYYYYYYYYNYYALSVI